MELSNFHIQVLNAEVCPYCKSETRMTTETEIYGREYKGRSVIACKNYPSCDSYVGTHDDGSPLGRLANKELRDWKIKAHASFDRLWKDKKKSRSGCYAELSEVLNLPGEYTHIGMFNIQTLKKVEAWSKLKYSELI